MARTIVRRDSHTAVNCEHGPIAYRGKLIIHEARVAKLADARDLKSL